MRGTLSTELEVGAPAQEVWAVISSPNSPNLILTLFPNMYEKFEIVKGNGGVGSLLHVIRSQGSSSIIIKILARSLSNLFRKIMRGHVTNELDVDLPADDVWVVYRSPDLPKLIVELQPGVFEKLDIVEGDGGVGTILHIILASGIDGPREWKEEFVEINDETRTKVVRQVKGGFLDIGFQLYEDVFKIIERGPCSCTIESSVFFQVEDKLIVPATLHRAAVPRRSSLQLPQPPLYRGHLAGAAAAGHRAAALPRSCAAAAAAGRRAAALPRRCSVAPLPTATAAAIVAPLPSPRRRPDLPPPPLLSLPFSAISFSPSLPLSSLPSPLLPFAVRRWGAPPSALQLESPLGSAGAAGAPRRSSLHLSLSSVRGGGARGGRSKQREGAHGGAPKKRTNDATSREVRGRMAAMVATSQDLRLPAAEAATVDAAIVAGGDADAAWGGAAVGRRGNNTSDSGDGG
ncbi:hypothetical protein Scep_026996 [Stephania cephalantha]|uniref:Uncharacterized protein n=1 Tax=Stephania cephalantha TaxID=152367 RepID=A0AAP0EPE0_9MAGN